MWIYYIAVPLGRLHRYFTLLGVGRPFHPPGYYIHIANTHTTTYGHWYPLQHRPSSSPPAPRHGVIYTQVPSLLCALRPGASSDFAADFMQTHFIYLAAPKWRLSTPIPRSLQLHNWLTVWRAHSLGHWCTMAGQEGNDHMILGFPPNTGSAKSSRSQCWTEEREERGDRDMRGGM